MKKLNPNFQKQLKGEIKQNNKFINNSLFKK